MLFCKICRSIEALEFSNAMAALNCLGLGARGHIGGLEEVHRLMAHADRRSDPAIAARAEAAERLAGPLNVSLTRRSTAAFRLDQHHHHHRAECAGVPLPDSTGRLLAERLHRPLGPDGDVSRLPSGGYLHFHVHPRRLDAHHRQHDFSVVLRAQPGRRHGVGQVSGLSICCAESRRRSRNRS